MPQCPRCKEDVARDAAFCENCGTDLRARGARPGDVILVLDRGLIQFGKFALALLGMFLVVGAFVFGFDLENLVSEMGERRAEMDAARQQVATATDQAEVAVAALNDKLTSAETDIADATTRLEARLADSKVQIDELKTKVAEAETQVSDIKAKVSEAESALRRIRAAREKAEVVVADLLDLSGEQVAAIERRAASELETAEVTLGPPATADRLHSDKLFEPGQTLSYAFLGTASNDVKRLIAEALAEWAAHANLDFRLVEKPADAIIRIGLRRGEGSWAYLGRDDRPVRRAHDQLRLGRREARATADRALGVRAHHRLSERAPESQQRHRLERGSRVPALHQPAEQLVSGAGLLQHPQEAAAGGLSLLAGVRPELDHDVPDSGRTDGGRRRDHARARPVGLGQGLCPGDVPSLTAPRTTSAASPGRRPPLARSYRLGGIGHPIGAARCAAARIRERNTVYRSGCQRRRRAGASAAPLSCTRSCSGPRPT